jgi:hypothetical protein
MRGRRTVAAAMLTVLVLAVFVAAPSAASGHYWNHCALPKVFLKGTLRVHAVRCPKARYVIGQFLTRAQSEGPDVQIGKFHCLGVRDHVSCRAGRQRIKLHGLPG